MNSKEQLQQELLELHYDLLDEQEANELRSRIETEPDVAALWAETLRLAGKIANAAKAQSPQTPDFDVRALVDAQPSSNGRSHVDTSDPTFATVPANRLGDLNTADKTDSKADDEPPVLADLVEEPPAKPTQPSETPAPPAKPVTRLSTREWIRRSTVIAATAASIGFAIIAWNYTERAPEQPVAALRVQAEPATAHEAASSNEFRFTTSRMDAGAVQGFPVVPASLSFSVLCQRNVLFSGTAETNSDGSGRVVLPDSLLIPEGSSLVVTATSAGGQVSRSTLEIPLEPTRCITHLSIDRPVYRPGETIFFRSLTLQRRTLQAGFEVPIRFELFDPSGAAVAGMYTEGVTESGVGNGAFTLPTTAAGGTYKLVAKSLDGFFPDEEREVQVRAYRVPQFKKEIEFRRRSYGPGETVEAEFKAELATGGPLANVSAQVTAVVDGDVIHEQATTTAADGTLVATFNLPEFVRDGTGRLSITVDDGATQETQSKTIPIQLGRVEVEFYPEGGYLVEGLLNRVYFSARDSLGEPIHVQGEIQSRSGQSVATIQTVRDGMGRFEFVPSMGERYTLKVLQPVDVTNTPKLPAVVKDLPVMDTGTGVFGANKQLSLVLRSNSKRTAIVRAVCRGQLVGELQKQLLLGDNKLTLPIRNGISGVIRVTVIDGDSHQPLVERLVFRRNDQQLNVSLVGTEADHERSPGEPLRLKLKVTDEEGKPAPAILGIAVVDDAALSLEEDERPSMQTHFMLTSEVQSPEDLEHANFYLSDEEGAEESLDLLLGTQGWRRFVSGTASEADVDFRQQLIRLLELDGEEIAAVPPSFDNRGTFDQQFHQYRVALAGAWEHLLVQARFLMLAVLLIWLGAVVVRLRSAAHSSVAALLLVTSVSWLLVGCSASENSVIMPASQQVDERADAAMETEEFSAKVESRNRRTEPSATPPPAPMADAPAAGAVADAATDDPVIEAPEEAPADSAVVAQTGPGFANRSNLANRSTGENDDSDNARYAKYHAISKGDRADVSRLISPEQLEQLLNARGIDAKTLADQLMSELQFPVRQYAHQHPKRSDEVREDFAETLYWQPLVKTDSQGEASIRFDLSDSVTTFRVHVDGHSLDGRLGSGGGMVTSRLPFQIEPKLPLEVTTGDRIDLPVAVINATDSDVGIELAVKASDELKVADQDTQMLSLGGNQRTRHHVAIDVVEGSAEIDAEIEIGGVAGTSLRDTVRRKVHISPAGYPASESLAGVLTRRATVQLPVPNDIVDGSLAVTLRAYPSPLADVMSGVESILREPHGCFEQTSATNYPNTMALQYMQKNDIANPDVSRRARGMLDRGYTKLTSFECEKRGYEWFGKDPGHEALSAFGLMQFTDMAAIMEVNDVMMVRTRKWLMGRRDGKGGFHRNPRHLHVWSVKQEIVNAYVLWAISEADVATGHSQRAASELATEIDHMHSVANKSDDPYLIALSAATLMNVKRTTEGEALLQKLAQAQGEDGLLQGKTTVTSSGGVSLKVETTALATLAFIKSPKYIDNARAAAKWITTNRRGNAGFGSTQATVLALKALVAIAEHSGNSGGGGKLQVLLHGEVIGQAELPTRPESGSTVEIVGLGQHLQDAEPGATIELVAKNARNLSYSIDLSYHAITPRSDDGCPFELTTNLNADANVAAGDTMTVSTVLENKTDQGQPMTVAIVGLPGGLEPRQDELDELKEAGEFDYYELRGREVVFYWRTIAPRESKEIEFTVTAEIPGKYTGPASRTYLYYTAEQKVWVEPLAVEIAMP